ncbi:MAG: hypothetical protein HGA31_03225 [Candidatus Moranbacteria bacterium]|nr:hypothetical protein [Candidatus Moranbacteria bacterium]
MRPFFPRSVALLTVSLLCGSLLPIISGSPVVSLTVLFSLSVAATLMNGFSRALPLAILSGLLCDISMLGTLGLSAAFCVALVYAASFSSRRVVADRGIAPFFVSGTIIGTAVVGFRFVVSLISGAGFVKSMAAFSIGSVGISILTGIMIFPIVFVLFRKIDAWASSFDTRTFV